MTGIYDRYSNGLMVNQLVTDFGRTRELVTSSRLHARAEQEDIVTARADVLLRVDQSYYEVLKAQALRRIAQETVKDRQGVFDQAAVLFGPAKLPTH
jgi:outer membrane protein